MPIPSKYLNFYFTVPPAVSTLTEQTSTIAKNLESAIDMSNLMLKYIPPETLLQEHGFNAESPLFASALNKGSYGYNGFGHNIVVDDFFEQEGTELLRKKAKVVKSVPLAMGKKPTTALRWPEKHSPQQLLARPVLLILTINHLKVLLKVIVMKSQCQKQDVINPLIEQEIYIYDCYTMDITDAQYNNKTGIKICPTKK